MEAKSQRVFSSNEGAGEPVTEVEISTEQLAAAAGILPEVEQTISITERAAEPEVPTEQQPEVESEQPTGPPPGYENIPKELWPDKDGNPPKLTDRLVKTLRRKYFTVRHPVMPCGHKLDMINQPGNNCDTCWFQFFNTHGQLVEVADQFYKTHGKQPMVAMRGAKFVKNFCRFMATVHHLLEEQKANVARNSEGNASGVNSTTPGTLGDGTICEEAGVGSLQAADQIGQAVSRGISSGLIQQG